MPVPLPSPRFDQISPDLLGTRSVLQAQTGSYNLVETDSEPIWIHVRLLTGEVVLAVETEANLTVWDLKLRVMEAVGMEPSGQELFKDGELEPLQESTKCAELRTPASPLDDTFGVNLIYVLDGSSAFAHLINSLNNSEENISEFTMDVNIPGTMDANVPGFPQV